MMKALSIHMFVIDTKDPVNWGYNKKGQYVYMSSDDDFEQDEQK